MRRIVSRTPGIPEHLRHIFRELPNSTMHTPQALAAVGLKSAGWDVIPLKPNEKAIDKATGYKHGHRKQLPDMGETVAIWQDNPERNVGIVPSAGTVCVDLDTKHGAGLHTLNTLGLPVSTLTERTQSGGWHLWFGLPRGFVASKSSTGNRRLPAGVDLIAGTGLVVSPWSIIDGRAYQYVPDSGWTMATITADWEFLDLLIDVDSVKFGRITREDREKARNLLHKLRHKSELRTLVNGLFTERWQDCLAELQPHSTQHSESHRDFILAFLGTHHLRNHERAPQILYALLELTGWPQNPFRLNPKSDPKAYIRSTVSRALVARTAKDHARLEALATRYGLPATGLAGHGTSCLMAPPFPDGTLSVLERTGEREIVDLVGGFVSMVGVLKDEEFERENGWVRIPVEDMAELFGVNRKTISRALARGEELGYWERTTERYRHDGAVRCDSLIRLI